MGEGHLAISVENLKRRFPGCDALGGVSFALPRGAIGALLGPNGSGKTTLLRVLAGVLAPTSGHAIVAGQDVTQQSLEARRRIGYLSETAPLYLEMRVGEYLTFRGGLYGLSGSNLAKRLRTVLELCQLGDVQRRVIGLLSRGFRQRVALAACFLHEPDVLLLDEPTGALDPAQAQACRNILRTRSPSQTVLFSTHSIRDAEQLAQHLLILNAGRVAAWSSPADLIQSMRAADPGSPVAHSPLEAAYLQLTAPPVMVRDPTTSGQPS